MEHSHITYLRVYPPFVKSQYWGTNGMDPSLVANHHFEDRLRNRRLSVLLSLLRSLTYLDIEKEPFLFL